MSRLNELIEEFCPNGVEYRRLEEVCKITKGEQLNKTKFISSGEYPVINGGIDPSGYYNKYNKIENTITISQGGANAGYVNYIKTKFWSNAHCYTVDSVEDFMEYKYIYYFLKNSEYTLMNSQYGAGIPALSMKTLGKLEIPVPPLEIQEEIVRILDNFTELTKELTSNLTKELETRKIQYEYYRDELLKNKNYNTEVVKLTDVCKYSKDRINSSDLDENTYVGVDNLLQDKQGKDLSSYVPKTGTSIKYSKGDVLVGNIRPYLRKIWLADNEGGTNGDVLVLKPNQKKIIPEYLYHILASESFFEYNNRFSKGAKMPRGDKEMIMKYDIPLPTMDIQKRIADVLGNFESICSDLNIGLPAEIEARQKQYEYYRDKLLSFK